MLYAGDTYQLPRHEADVLVIFMTKYASLNMPAIFCLHFKVM